MAFTTYARIAEQAERLLGKYTDDSDITRQELVLHVKQHIAWRAMEDFYRAKSDEFAYVDGGLVVPFKSITVSLDTDTNEYYIELPSSSADLLYGMGINAVSPSANAREVYVPVINGFSGLYDGLASSNLGRRIGYYTENDRLVFVNMDASNNPPAVNIKLVAPIDGIDDDARVNVPADVQREIILDIIQLYAGKRPADITNDQIDQV